MKQIILYNKVRMTWISRLLLSVVVMIICTISGCVDIQSSVEKSRDIQKVRTNDIIEFSGYKWRVKKSNVLMGPGPNLFSGGPENIWVDEQDRLHLKITQINGDWFCSELGCETALGYGTYVFYMGSRVDNLAPNIVVGLFTWDDDTYQSQANCEIDIEFALWMSKNAPNLHYSVHPVRGPDEGGVYRERFRTGYMKLTGQLSTHVFTWTPDGVVFASFDGHRHPTPKIIKNWKFSASNPPRRAGQGDDISKPVLIPEPGPNTRVRMNLWLVDGNSDGRGDAPENNEDIEVIVDRFEFFPAE